MMGATIELFKSSVLGFDLDTKRPWFRDQVAAEAYMSGKAGKTWRSTNWNRIGDPMIAPMSFTEASGYDIGMITLDTASGQPDTMKYWFRVRDVRVNETNRTEIVYDIDFMQTFAYHMKAGHVDRVPKMTVKDNLIGFGRGIPLNPRRWVWESLAPIFSNGIQIAIVATKATIGEKTIEGPVYFFGSCEWVMLSMGSDYNLNPINWLVKKGVIAALDIVNAWAVPGIFDKRNEPRTGGLQYWKKVFETIPQDNMPWYWIKYTDCTPMAHLDALVDVTLPDDMKSGLTYPAIEGDTESAQFPIMNGTDTTRGLV